jgi:hypothetical protein
MKILIFINEQPNALARTHALSPARGPTTQYFLVTEKRMRNVLATTAQVARK